MGVQRQLRRRVRSKKFDAMHASHTRSLSHLGSQHKSAVTYEPRSRRTHHRARSTTEGVGGTGEVTTGTAAMEAVMVACRMDIVINPTPTLTSTIRLHLHPWWSMA